MHQVRHCAFRGEDYIIDLHALMRCDFKLCLALLVILSVSDVQIQSFEVTSTPLIFVFCEPQFQFVFALGRNHLHRQCAV